MGATAFVATTAGSAGQYLVSNATSAPTFQTATPQLVVTPVAVATQAMTSNHKYIANDASLTTFTLPTSSSVGDIIQIVGSCLLYTSKSARDSAYAKLKEAQRRPIGNGAPQR